MDGGAEGTEASGKRWEEMRTGRGYERKAEEDPCGGMFEYTSGIRRPLVGRFRDGGK